MWNYCTYLGEYTNRNGRRYDLGVHIAKDGTQSLAAVYGSFPGEYISGHLNVPSVNEDFAEVKAEVKRRLQDNTHKESESE